MKIIIALIIFGITVIFHEFGHFITAKKCGIGVTEFAVGMGPKLYSFKKGDTEYSIRLLPLGGFCSMVGEDEKNDSEDAFNNKGPWQRFLTLFAGPFFNFVLAFVLAIVLIAMIGADVPSVISVEEGSPAAEAGLKAGDIITSYNGSSVSVGREMYLSDFVHPLEAGKDLKVSYERDGKSYDTVIVPVERTGYLMGVSYTNDEKACQIDVTDGGAAAEAGLKADDVITEINGVKISSGSDFYEYTSNADNLDGSDVTIKYERDGKESTVTVTPKENTSVYTGLTYNSNYSNINVKQNPLGVIKYSLLEDKYQIKSVFLSLEYIFTGHASRDSISGPVGIVNMVGDVYEQSIAYGILAVVKSMLSFTIMISANLGVMNLLPLPALDGGRILFVLIELVRGKPVDPDKEGFVHFIGFVLLMILMVFVMWNDLTNIFSK